MENQHLKKILEEGYEFKFGQYISQGFSLFGKNVGGFVVFGLLAGLIIMTVGIIPILGDLLSNLILLPALTVGVYLVANKIEKRIPTDFNDFFKGFDFVGQLALVALVSSMITIVATIPFGIANWSMIEWGMGVFENPFEIEYQLEDFPGVPVWTWLMLIPSIYLAVSYSWASMFVVFHKMNFWDAMETSRQFITQKWLIYFIFLIVIGLLAGMGVIFFFIGILFTYPIMLCAQYAAFADVTRLDLEEEADLVDHLVD